MATVEAIHRYTRRDETIFVFGYGPKLYWDADRPPAIRYIGTEKAGQLGPHGQAVFDEITTLLTEARPKAVVVHPDHFKRSPLIKGLDTSAMEAWLRANYDPPGGGRPAKLWIRHRVPGPTGHRSPAHLGSEFLRVEPDGRALGAVGQAADQNG